MSLIDNTIDLKQLIPNDKQDKGKLINFDGNIQQLVLNLLQEGNISGDIMAGDRNINIKRGNYNERIEGNYYEQKGNNNTMTNVTQNHSGSGDNVAGDKNITNNYNSQDLAQAAADIQKLLEQLGETYPTDTLIQKATVAEKTIEQIKANKNWQQKVISAVKAMGIKAFMEMIDNPVVNVLSAGIEEMID